MEIFGYQIDKKVSNNRINKEALDVILKNVDEEKRETILKLYNQTYGASIVYEIFKNGKEVGNIEFNEVESGKPRIGVEIKKDFRRNGIAYMMLKELMKKILEEYQVEYFIYQVRGDNEASIGLVEKLGGKFIKNISAKDILSISTYHIIP